MKSGLGRALYQFFEMAVLMLAVLVVARYPQERIVVEMDALEVWVVVLVVVKFVKEIEENKPS